MAPNVLRMGTEYSPNGTKCSQRGVVVYKGIMLVKRTSGGSGIFIKAPIYIQALLFICKHLFPVEVAYANSDVIGPAVIVYEPVEGGLHELLTRVNGFVVLLAEPHDVLVGQKLGQPVRAQHHVLICRRQLVERHLWAGEHSALLGGGVAEGARVGAARVRLALHPDARRVCGHVGVFRRPKLVGDGDPTVLHAESEHFCVGMISQNAHPLIGAECFVIT
mmetsp:Transcript_30135/g.50701  ORF Transcript_30135/g.50701 Transcript_30135/m.50701 type:complete len:220 (-) Transcript_30135:836-1495(-)